MPITHASERQLAEIKAARSWAAMPGAHRGLEADQTPEASVVEAALEGNVQAIAQLRLQMASLGDIRWATASAMVCRWAVGSSSCRRARESG